MDLSADRLVVGCADDGADAGILLFSELEPLAGFGAPVKPAVYEGRRYQIDRRWAGAGDERAPVDVVVIDNVPSQANRLEQAMCQMRSVLGLPEIELDLSPVEALPPHLPHVLSSFQFPHRQADAYLRDAVLDGQPFEQTEVGVRLFSATREDAIALLEWFPQSLLFGFWQSHLGKKRSQAKLARSWVSEVVGIEPASTDTQVLGVKGDPLNLTVDAKVKYDENDVCGWELTDEKSAAVKGKKSDSLSNIGHGQVPFKRGEESLGGVSFGSIEQRASVSFAGLRQVRVGSSEQNAAARALVVALGIVAHVRAFGSAFHLRSGCDLRPLRSAWSWFGDDGTVATEPLRPEAAKDLFADCVERAEAVGLPVGKSWPQPLSLAPSEQLAAVIRRTWPASD